MRNTTLAPNAKAAILIQVTPHRKVLFSKGIEKRLPIASITKLMTMLVILEGIDAGVLDWNEMVEISSGAASIYGSKINLRAKEKHTLENLFKSMIISSANDSALALAEHFSGKMEDFAAKMNEKAIELGLRNTHFDNSHGLFEDNNYSSARDVAVLALASLKRKEILKYSRLKEDYFKKEDGQLVILKNTNKLIGLVAEVDGLKTGHTYSAGYCLVVTALKDSIRLIAIVLGEPSKTMREREILEMLKFGYRISNKKLRSN